MLQPATLNWITQKKITTSFLWSREEKKITKGKGERIVGLGGPSGDYSAMGRHPVLERVINDT